MENRYLPSPVYDHTDSCTGEVHEQPVEAAVLTTHFLQFCFQKHHCHPRTESVI